MMRSLSKPHFLCSTARNTTLRPFSQQPFRTLPSKSLSTGVSRIRVRFGIIRSMSTSSSSSVERIGNLLSGRNDDHGGVIVEMTTDPVDAVAFGSLLRASISHWRQEGKKGVWIKMPIELVNLVEPAVKEGFYFHHAEPKYLMLVYWIPETPNTIPANATHRVGIGGFVMNEKKEMLHVWSQSSIPITWKSYSRVLVVQEKSGFLRGTGVWKFPTGVVEEGEDICDAAVREVKEETGIDTKFEEILAFRQSHKSFFEKSDLFFVCLLQPLSFNIQPQESEIEAAQWMPFDEYAAQGFVQKNELLKYINNMCSLKREGKYSGFSQVPTTSTFSTKDSYLYLNRQCLDSP